MNKDKPGDILIERLKIIACCKGYTELIKKLGVKQTWLAQSRKTGKVHPQLKQKLIEHGMDPWWVEMGVGKPYLASKNGSAGINEIIYSHPRSKKIPQLFSEQALKSFYEDNSDNNSWH